MKKFFSSILVFTTIVCLSFAAQPELFPDTFQQSAKWQSPVLKLKTTENNFTLKGKNIFSEDTTFRLISKKITENKNAFDSFIDFDEEIALTVLSNNSTNQEVVLQYAPENIPSGYYDLVAETTDGETGALQILVLSDANPEIDDSIYEYDENYKVNVLSVPRGQPYYLTVKGTGFNSSTLYSFYPTTTASPYPFTSNYETNEAAISLAEHSFDAETGDIELKLKIETDNMNTGYYYLDAINGYAGKISLLFLVKMESKPLEIPEIESIKTKTSGSTITFSLTGDCMDELSNFTLISPYSDAEDGNKSLSLEYLQSKKDETVHILQCKKTDLQPGRYALLIENLWASEIFYYDIDEKYVFTECQLTDKEIEATFLRPASKPENLNAGETVIKPNFEIYVSDYELFNGLRPVLPAFHVRGNLMTYQGYDFTAKNFDIEAAVDLLYLRWARLNAGAMYYNSNFYETTGFKYGGNLYLEIPGKFIKPFAGAGFYSTLEKDFTLPVQAGVRILDILEFTYQLSFEDFLTDGMYAIDKYTFGVQIPLRTPKYYYNVSATTADIADPDHINGAKYKLQNNTSTVSLNSKTVGGFANSKKIDVVYTSPNVITIEDKAFANMPVLQVVRLQKGLKSIGSKAFANDINLKSLDIPDTVTNISDGAFEGWTMSQTIRLAWSSDDETPRNLPGLDNTDAKIVYSDGIYYSNPTDNGPYNPENWTVKQNGFSGKVEKNTVVLKNGSTIPAIRFSGYSASEDGSIVSCIIKGGSEENPLYDTPCNGIKFKAVQESNSNTTIRVYYASKNNPSKIKVIEKPVEMLGTTELSYRFTSSNSIIISIEVEKESIYTDKKNVKAYYTLKLCDFEIME